VLEVVEHADHRALVDAQAPAERALRHRSFGVDHEQDLRVLAADALVCEFALESFAGVLGDERHQVAGPMRQHGREGRGDGHGHAPRRYRSEIVLTRDDLGGRLP
jgi:hypothetical protein